MRRTYCYKDPLNDDFAENNIRQKELPTEYQYISRNPFRRAFDFLFHHGIVVPIVFVFQKIVYAEKIVNRRVLRPYRRSGFYLYGNHTRGAGDAFTPNLVAFPRKAYIIINPDGVSIPVVRSLVRSLGGLPLPTKFSGMRNFHDAVMRLSEKHCMTIYPEAHIWPFYTGIRPFRDNAFRYPVQAQKPVFAFTVTYQKRRWIATPRTTVYVDGPFFPDPELSVRENQQKLRDQVYAAMVERSRCSTYSYHTYVDAREATNAVP